MELNSDNTQEVTIDTNKLGTESDIIGESEKNIDGVSSEENVTEEPGKEADASDQLQCVDESNLEEDVEALAQELNTIVVHPPTVEP